MKEHMKQMDYPTFLDEVFKELRENEEWNLKNSKMQFFVDGHVGKGSSDKQVVRGINREYYHTDSDIVRGDWLIIYNTDFSTYDFPMKLLYDFYCHMKDMNYVWIELRSILTGLNNSGRYSLLGGLWNYEKKRDHLVMKIVPCREEKHDGCIGFTHGDIAVILCNDTEPNTERARISYDHLGYWCKDEVSVVKEAFDHMVETNLAKIYVGIDVQENHLNHKQFRRTINIDTPIFLSNDEETNGSIALFYNDSQTTLSRLFTEGDFYVIMPTSDKAIIFPVSHVTEQQVRKKLQEILQETPEETVLSKQIRYYDSTKDSLEVL